MDDTTVLAVVRESDPATTNEIAVRLDADFDTVERRLLDLESIGRIEREGELWRLTRDPRLDSSISYMQDRLDGEKR
jgi:predicted transcriptional regulator